MDFVATSHQFIMNALVELGFKRQGKDSYLEELQVSIDIFCDRLRALVHWKEKEQLKWMTKLYESNELDQAYIYSRLIGNKEIEVADIFFQTIKEQEQ